MRTSRSPVIPGPEGVNAPARNPVIAQGILLKNAAANLLLNLPQVMAALAAAAPIGFVDYRLLVLGAAAGCLLSILPMLSKASRRAPAQPASA
jgi:hypothetical protein